jgi:hypothetical protein
MSTKVEKPLEASQLTHVADMPPMDVVTEGIPAQEHIGSPPVAPPAPPGTPERRRNWFAWALAGVIGALLVVAGIFAVGQYSSPSTSDLQAGQPPQAGQENLAGEGASEQIYAGPLLGSLPYVPYLSIPSIAPMPSMSIESIPPIEPIPSMSIASIPSISIPSMSMSIPAIAPISIPSISIPSFPSTPSTPSIEPIPSMSIPSIPSISFPSFPSIPTISIPPIEPIEPIAPISIPTISIPDM